MLRTRILVFLLLSLFLSVGCGQKGALYIPSKVQTKAKTVKKAPVPKSNNKDEAQQKKSSQH